MVLRIERAKQMDFKAFWVRYTETVGGLEFTFLFRPFITFVYTVPTELVVNIFTNLWHLHWRRLVHGCGIKDEPSGHFYNATASLPNKRWIHSNQTFCFCEWTSFFMFYQSEIAFSCITSQHKLSCFDNVCSRNILCRGSSVQMRQKKKCSEKWILMEAKQPNILRE